MRHTERTKLPTQKHELFSLNGTWPSTLAVLCPASKAFNDRYIIFLLQHYQYTNKDFWSEANMNWEYISMFLRYERNFLPIENNFEPDNDSCWRMKQVCSLNPLSFSSSLFVLVSLAPSFTVFSAIKSRAEWFTRCGPPLYLVFDISYGHHYLYTWIMQCSIVIYTGHVSISVIREQHDATGRKKFFYLHYNVHRKRCASIFGKWYLNIHPGKKKISHSHFPFHSIRLMSNWVLSCTEIQKELLSKVIWCPVSYPHVSRTDGQYQKASGKCLL